MTDINSMKCDLQQLYIRYDELTSSEEDKELRDYNEQLLESLATVQHYISSLEELLKKHMYIGIELEEKYYNIAQQRLQEATRSKQTTLI